MVSAEVSNPVRRWSLSLQRICPVINVTNTRALTTEVVYLTVANSINLWSPIVLKFQENIVAVAEAYPDCRTELSKDAVSSITRIRGAQRDT